MEIFLQQQEQAQAPDVVRSTENYITMTDNEDSATNKSTGDQKEDNDDTASFEKDNETLSRMKESAASLGLPPLKVVVMSATLDVKTFQTFFPESAMIKIPGRQYPVQVVYTSEPHEDYVDAALQTVMQIHKYTPGGDGSDVLVFLTGQDEIEDLMDQTTTLIKAVKEALKDLDKEGKEHAKKSKNDAEARTRQNMYNTLVKKFISVVQEYQEMQNKFKSKYRDRVGRQLKVVRPDATVDEINEMIESGGDQDIFKQQMLSENSTQAARNALADIQDKHKDIMRLEQSIVELHQLFVDMSVLVETQGEMLDQIEYSVQQAHQYVDKGVKQLEKAKESQKNARKRMCCIACCCVIFMVSSLKTAAVHAERTPTDSVLTHCTQMLAVGGVFGSLLGTNSL